MKTQTLFSGKWVQTQPLNIAEPVHLTLRGSQADAFKALKGEQHVILNAPTGWGKSVVISSLVADKLLRNPRLRCIISVPQTVIARGFTKKNWKLNVAGKIVEWCVGCNLCDAQTPDTISSLVGFLQSRRTSLTDRILVCTHATLAKAYKRLKDRGQLALLKNTVVWIDEAHHVMNAHVADSEEIVSNRLGGLVKHCLKSGCHVGLATATFQRGDMHHILPEPLAKHFTRFSIPYDVYLRDMQPLESFEFNIICGNTLKVLDSLFKKQQPTILYLAKRNSRFASDCKYTEVKQIIKCLSKHIGAKPRSNGVITQVGSLKVLDLVDDSARKRRARKAYLDKCGQVDLIIAQDTCKEGFDWPAASRSIILGERHSTPEMIQIIGRLLRRCNGKKHAEVYQVLPAVVPNSKQFKDQRNAILTVIFSAMLLEDVFIPIPYVDKERKQTRTDGFKAAPRHDITTDLLADFQLAAQGKDYDESLQLAPAVLKKHGIAKADWEPVWKRLWQRFALLTRRMKCQRLDVPFEVLKKTDINEGLLTLASGPCGITTFAELRMVIGQKQKTREEWIAYAKEVADENGGPLPNPKRLSKEHPGLYTAMRRNPDDFEGFQQEHRTKTRKTREEWVAYAKEVAQKNGGPLPNSERLKKEHCGLYGAMQRNPDDFEGIPQEHRIKTREEWVAYAKEVAQKNGGPLPNPRRLQKEYPSLNTAMRKNPDDFEGIPQERRTKTREEWVAYAKEVADENGGPLPNPARLQKEHPGLYAAMRRNPNDFEGFQQERRKAA